MFDFGDELAVESFRIPWLISIQLLVLLLLVVVFYCFTIFALDPSPSDDTFATTAANASSSTGRGFVFDDFQRIEKPVPKHDSPATVIINRIQHTQGGENTSIKGEIATSASRRIISGEEFAEGEESSSVYFHPCHYFRIARLAFLKCLGLDPSSDTPSTRKHRKRKGC